MSNTYHDFRLSTILLALKLVVWSLWKIWMGRITRILFLRWFYSMQKSNRKLQSILNDLEIANIRIPIHALKVTGRPAHTLISWRWHLQTLYWSVKVVKGARINAQQVCQTLQPLKLYLSTYTPDMVLERGSTFDRIALAVRILSEISMRWSASNIGRFIINFLVFVFHMN